MRFIGVDLAWSNRNPTGVAMLEGDERGAMLTPAPLTITGVDAVAEWIAHAAGDGAAHVAVDAPLCVPAGPKHRGAESALSRDFGRFKIGCHSSNREMAIWQKLGYVTGERLVELLTQRGFEATPSPATDARSARRVVFEVYPHPAIVVLFGLDKRLLYKKGPPATKREGLTNLRDLVHSCLPRAEPPLLASPTLDALCAEDLHLLRGGALKGYEDRLDAVICAYIAYWYWYWGAERCRMYGSIDDGHIIVPWLPARA
jgi:predicted RNase H-like nuclease